MSGVTAALIHLLSNLMDGTVQTKTVNLKVSAKMSKSKIRFHLHPSPLLVCEKENKKQ